MLPLKLHMSSRNLQFLGGVVDKHSFGDCCAQVDPLDAFMAEIDEQVQANAPNTRQIADGIECDEEADPVADYMEVYKVCIISFFSALHTEPWKDFCPLSGYDIYQVQRCQ